MKHFKQQTKIDIVNNSPVTLALSIIFLNVASKYIFSEVTPAQQYLLNNDYIKFISLTFIVFVQTKDIQTSLLFSSIIVIIFYLFNENFKFNILPNFVKKTTQKLIDKKLDNEQIIKAKKIIQNYEKIKENSNEEVEVEDKEYAIYKETKKQPIKEETLQTLKKQ